MFWIVGGSGLMLGLQKLGGNPVVDAIVQQLHHTDWQGLRFYDLIWPAFMLMTGMSVLFSYLMPGGRWSRLTVKSSCGSSGVALCCFSWARCGNRSEAMRLT